MGDKSGSLTWDVYVTELLPTASGDPPHGERQFLWQPTSAPLVSGQRDAILVDALLTVTQPGDLADSTAAHDKNLTAVYLTHGHGVLRFGLSVILLAFPGRESLPGWS